MKISREGLYTLDLCSFLHGFSHQGPFHKNADVWFHNEKAEKELKALEPELNETNLGAIFVSGRPKKAKARRDSIHIVESAYRHLFCFG